MEKNSANHISDKGLISKIYKNLSQLKKSDFNMGKRIKLTILQRGHQNGQQTLKKKKKSQTSGKRKPKP